MFTNPSVADFKSFFVRDFPYGTDISTSVTDTDIANGFMYTNVNIQPKLFADQSAYNLGYLYMSAHAMVLSLRTSSQGINGQFNFLQAGKGVGSVNETFAIPQRILDNPYWSMFTKTNYGMMFLQMVLPQLTGQVFAVTGRTKP